MAEDKVVLIQTAKTAITDLEWYENRADIATVLSDVITYAENTPGVPNKANFIAALKVARTWVKKRGNDRLGKLVGKAITSAVLFTKYFKPIQGKAVKAMCLKGQETYNALRSKLYKNKTAAFNARTKDFQYVGIEDILDAVIANAQASKLPNKAKFIKAIKKAKKWVKKTGTPALQKRVGKAITSAVLFNVHYKPTQIRVLMKKCGFTLASVPSIDKVTNRGKAHNPATVIQGKEAKVVIKGKHFPKEADIAISILIGKDSDKTITVTKIKRVDAKTIELTIKAAANSPTDKARTVEVFHKKHPKLLLAQKADAIKVSAPTCSQTLSVTPNALKKGETKEVTVTINCGKLPASPALVVDPAGVTVSNVRKISDTVLKFTASVPSDATPGARTIKVMDGSRVLAQGSFNVAPIGAGTTSQRIGDFAYTNPATAFSLRYGPIVGGDVWNAELTAGFSSSALKPQRENLPASFRAAAENSSLLSAKVTLGDRHHPVPVVGKENTLANAISGKNYKMPSWFTLGANLQLALDYNPKDTVLGMAGLGVNLIFSPAKQLDIDIYGHYSFRGSDYIDPNRLMFSGSDQQVAAGLAFASNLGTKLAYLKLYAEYVNSWRSYSDDTFGFKFGNSGGDYAVNTGIQLALSLNRKFKGKAVPNIWLDASGTVAGKRLVPEYSEGIGVTGTTPENVMGWNILLTAQWLNIPGYKPYVGFRSEGQYQHGWDLLTRYQAIIGLDSKKLGRFDLRYTYTDNPVLHYGQQSHSVSLRYNLPILRQALFGEIQYDNIAGQHFGRGIIGIDILKLLPTSK